MQLLTPTVDLHFFADIQSTEVFILISSKVAISADVYIGKNVLLIMAEL